MPTILSGMRERLRISSLLVARRSQTGKMAHDFPNSEKVLNSIHLTRELRAKRSLELRNSPTPSSMNKSVAQLSSAQKKQPGHSQYKDKALENCPNKPTTDACLEPDADSIMIATNGVSARVTPEPTIVNTESHVDFIKRLSIRDLDARARFSDNQS
eukprot:475380_1